MTDLEDLISVITAAAAGSPRSRQVALGPSELGEPCDRQLAYKLSGAAKTSVDSDPWASIVGTAVHAWLAAAYQADNLALAQPRWLVEHRVSPHPGYTGHCDLYDTYTDTVIDHKVVGITSLKAIRRDGPSPGYQIQGQLYGLGWARVGRTPRSVAIVGWPRSGFLSQAIIWRTPYDPAVAEAALERATRLSAAALRLTHLAVPLTVVNATPSDSCRFCQYRSIFDGDGGCPDAPSKPIPTSLPGI